MIQRFPNISVFCNLVQSYPECPNKDANIRTAEMNHITATALDNGMVQSICDLVHGYVKARYRDFPVGIVKEVPFGQVWIVNNRELLHVEYIKVGE